MHILGTGPKMPSTLRFKSSGKALTPKGWKIVSLRMLFDLTMLRTGNKMTANKAGKAISKIVAMIERYCKMPFLRSKSANWLTLSHMVKNASLLRLPKLLNKPVDLNWLETKIDKRVFTSR